MVIKSREIWLVQILKKVNNDDQLSITNLKIFISIFSFTKLKKVVAGTAKRSYHEWQHRQCGECVFQRTRIDPAYYTLNLQGAFACAGGAQGSLPYKWWGVTASQWDLLSLTLLFVTGCGRLQLGAAHWATSVLLLQVVDNRAQEQRL